MLLVVIVVLVFLQGWRAALIPIIAIPVSLVGVVLVVVVLDVLVLVVWSSMSSSGGHVDVDVVVLVEVDVEVVVVVGVSVVVTTNCGPLVCSRDFMSAPSDPLTSTPRTRRCRCRSLRS